MKRDNPFFVRLDEVPRNGRTLSIELEEEWVAPLLTPAYSSDGKVAKASADIERDGDNLIVKGEVEVGLTYACSRCGQDVVRTFHSPVKAIFVPEASHHVRLNDFENDDEALDDLFGYESRNFSIEQPFVDAVNLALEAYPDCGDGCLGAPVVDEPEPVTEKPVDPRWEKLAELKEKLKR